MAYGDGGFYFLQPVSQPAGAYGAIGSYGALSKGRKIAGHQLKYQSYEPKTLEDHENEVAKLLVIVEKIRTSRAKTRKKIKGLRRALRTHGGFMVSAMRLPLMKQLSHQLKRLKLLNEALKIALKNYNKAKKKLEDRRPKAVRFKPLPLLPNKALLEALKRAKAEKEAAEADLEAEDAEEAEMDAEPYPEDEPMVDEVVVEEEMTMAPSMFEEHKNLIYLGGAAVGAFALYKLLK